MKGSNNKKQNNIMPYIAIGILILVGYLIYDYNKELPTIKWNRKLENDYKDVKLKKNS